MVRDALPVIPPLHHLFLPSAEERGREDGSEDEKQGREGVREEKAGGGRKGGESDKKKEEKITPLPGFLSMGKG